ncbi:lantibiotic dehydratase [Streptomyces mayteni]
MRNGGAGQEPLFDPAEPLLLRMAAVPRGSRPAPPPGVAPDSAEGVRRAAADPRLREAIRIAGDSLADQLDRLDAGAEPTPKRLARAARSLTRYALRHGDRPTPFGIFAGVTAAGLAPRAEVSVRGPGVRDVRIDGEWLSRRVADWLESPAVRRRVTVVANDLGQLRDGRLVLARGARETSVRANRIVGWVHDTLTAPTPYPELLAAAGRHFRAAPPDHLDRLFGQLVRHGFLLTDITPHRVDEELLDRIAAAVAPLADAADELRRVRAALAACRAAGPGAWDPAWRRLRELTDAAGPRRRPAAHVDLAMDARVALPRAVAEEAGRYAEAMWTISREWSSHAHMRDYHLRFVERYGTGAAVPLATLIDPHRGIGLPDFPTGHPGAVPAGDPGARRARRILTAELTQAALLTEERELALTDRDIADLATPVEAEPPRTLELCFQLLAESRAALDRGDFRLLSTPHTGSWTAGATAGRFAELAGLTEGLAGLAAAGGAPGELPAQLDFPPTTERALNLIQVPRLLPHRIPVGIHADRTDPHVLDWRRLLVTAEPDGLRLLTPDGERQVRPVVPHLLALDREGPPVARLLVDILLGRSRTWTGWDWEGLEALPVLPRVRLGRVVVSPTRWTPDRRMREAARHPAAWDDAVRAWRDRYRVPDRVQVTRWDRSYGIDLADPWHRTLLRDELTTDASGLMVTEDPAADGAALGWAAGHATEVVIPLVRRHAPHPAPRPRPVVVPAHPARHLPGEDWLFAKLYAQPDRQYPVLRTLLPMFLAEAAADVDRWFFLRYTDPEPHLRLRLHGDPEALRTRTLPALARHARTWLDQGAVGGLTLDVYQPEVDRYGGPELLPHAERLFCLDSRSAIAQLGDQAPPDEVRAAVNHALLLESLGDWDWCSWVDLAFPKGPDHETFQRHRAAALAAIHPGGVAERLPADHPAAAAWAAAEEPAALGRLLLPRADRDGILLSLLHMQHNRLLGIDRARENRGYAVLRGVARAHLGRARARTGAPA